jgi:hypothetical protein
MVGSGRRVALAVGVLAGLAGAPEAGAAPGDIFTVAGNGTAGFSGDGGPATAAQLSSPFGVAATADGGFLVADPGNHRIRRVSPTGGIATVAGTGTQGFSGDGGPATSARLSAPSAVAVMADGGFLIADLINHRIRRVSPDGTIATVAGTGTQGFSGDGGPATAAQLSNPLGVARTADNGFLIGDSSNERVRRVSPEGTITTVAGTGPSGLGGFSGDGGPATAAQLNFPAGVSATAGGGFLVADTSNDRVRQVSPEGTIATVAGTGASGSSGDGGPATAAQLSSPFGVAAAADGGFLVADQSSRVRGVSATGIIATVAGTGTRGFSGDEGPATAAELNGPNGVALTAGGGVLIADTGNSRVRLVEGDPGVVTPPEVPGTGPPAVPLPGAVVLVRARLSGLSLTNRVFAAGRASTPLLGRATRRVARGTVFAYRLDLAAWVRIEVQQRLAGRRVGRTCRLPTRALRRRPRCTRVVVRATLRRQSRAGLNRVAFTGRVRGRALPAGRYRALFTAVNAAGPSAPRALGFRIVRR